MPGVGALCYVRLVVEMFMKQLGSELGTMRANGCNGNFKDSCHAAKHLQPASRKGIAILALTFAPAHRDNKKIKILLRLRLIWALVETMPSGNIMMLAFA